MTKDSTRKATEPAKKPPNPNSGYLPVLPEGWTYGVIAWGGDGWSVRVEPGTGDDTGVSIEVMEEATRKIRVTTADTLRDGLRVAADLSRKIAAVEAQERAARDARQDALEGLGDLTGGASVGTGPDAGE